MNTINTIKLNDILADGLAIDYTKARDISNDIIKSNKEKWIEIVFDFEGIQSTISPFLRELLTPLIKYSINYKIEWINGDYSEMLKRIEYSAKNSTINITSIKWIDE